MQAVGLTDPLVMASAKAPTSPGTALFTTTEVPSAKRSLAALGTGAGSIARAGTQRCTSGVSRRDSLGPSSAAAALTALRSASISAASAGPTPGKP